MIMLGIDTGFLARVLSSDGLVPLALAMIAVFFLMSSLRRKQRNRVERPAGPSARPAVHEPNARLQNDLNDLLVELQELSRKISAEIDTRFAKLEAAIRDADRRIAVLHRLTRAAGQPPSTPGPTEASDSRHAIVHELADTGFTPVEIARELGKTPGEVELILNLRKQADASPS